MKNADKPAVPFQEVRRMVSGIPTEYKNHTGITKREMFAMHAMQGLLAANPGWKDYSSPMTNEQVAQEAVDLADDLLEALDRCD